jgi:G:T-mismatch repair DNA endonuclease (very short patch repair protein)
MENKVMVRNRHIKKKLTLNLNEIKRLYIDELKNITEIAKIMGCNQNMIYYSLKSAGILMNQSERMKLLYSKGKIKIWSKGLSKENNRQLLEISNRMKENNPMKNIDIAKKVTESNRQRGNFIKVSERMKNNNPMQNQETAKKTGIKQREIGHYDKISKLMKNGGGLKARISNRCKPNKPEQVMIDLIKENNLPFNYVGNGKIWFKGETQHFNPDFLSKNPKHIIEVFGKYWHKNTQKDDKERLATYSKYGYKTLIIWDYELKNPNLVIDKIRGFII